MPKRPLISTEDMMRHCAAYLARTGKPAITVKEVIAIAKEQGALDHLLLTMIGHRQQERLDRYREEERRREDTQRQHREALEAVRVDKEALQEENDALREASKHAGQEIREARDRTAAAERALADLRVHGDKREAAYHEERLRSMAQFEVAQQAKDDAIRAQYAIEQRVSDLEAQLERAQADGERERARADAATVRADALEQRLEQARTIEITTAQEMAALRQEIAALRPELHGKDLLIQHKDVVIQHLQRELARVHPPSTPPEPDVTQEADRDAAD